jgi:hypothetical protein
MTDLAEEYVLALRQARELVDVAALREVLNIPRLACPNSGPLGLARVQTQATGLYEPAEEDGVMVVIAPVLVSAPGGFDVSDLIAFPFSPPHHRFWLRTGAGRVLGEWNIAAVRDQQMLYPEPKEPAPVLELYPSPIEWLQWGGRGVCFLHDVWARTMLAGVDHVRAQNRAHARKLSKLFEQRWPNIVLEREAKYGGTGRAPA